MVHAIDRCSKILVMFGTIKRTMWQDKLLNSISS